MKSLTAIVTCLLLLAGVSFAGITGSPHDLSSSNDDEIRSTDQDQVCIFCHTPHFASATQKPLWNRNDSGEAFVVYSSPTMDAYAPGNLPPVDGVSVLCLSCHDGVTAVNSLLYNGALGAAPAMVGAVTTLNGRSSDLHGDGLTNDHPISFVYQAALDNGDAELQDPAPAWGVDVNGKVQCSSCHDVHDYGASASFEPFLTQSKSGSALCLGCHLK